MTNLASEDNVRTPHETASEGSDKSWSEDNVRTPHETASEDNVRTPHETASEVKYIGQQR
jgi:hypothetical protein